MNKNMLHNYWILITIDLLLSISFEIDLVLRYFNDKLISVIQHASPLKPSLKITFDFKQKLIISAFKNAL